jgi:hypothetical protein
VPWFSIGKGALTKLSKRFHLSPATDIEERGVGGVATDWRVILARVEMGTRVRALLKAGFRRHGR